MRGGYDSIIVSDVGGEPISPALMEIRVIVEDSNGKPSCSYYMRGRTQWTHFITV